MLHVSLIEILSISAYNQTDVQHTTHCALCKDYV